MKLFYRNHTTSGSFIRVWREGWAGDQFEVLSADSFRAMQSLLAGAVEFVEADED